MAYYNEYYYFYKRLGGLYIPQNEKQLDTTILYSDGADTSIICYIFDNSFPMPTTNLSFFTDQMFKEEKISFHTHPEPPFGLVKKGVLFVHATTVMDLINFFARASLLYSEKPDVTRVDIYAVGAILHEDSDDEGYGIYSWGKEKPKKPKKLGLEYDMIQCFYKLLHKANLPHGIRSTSFHGWAEARLGLKINNKTGEVVQDIETKMKVKKQQHIMTFGPVCNSDVFWEHDILWLGFPGNQEEGFGCPTLKKVLYSMDWNKMEEELKNGSDNMNGLFAAMWERSGRHEELPRTYENMQVGAEWGMLLLKARPNIREFLEKTCGR